MGIHVGVVLSLVLSPYCEPQSSLTWAGRGERLAKLAAARLSLVTA